MCTFVAKIILQANAKLKDLRNLSEENWKALANSLSMDFIILDKPGEKINEISYNSNNAAFNEPLVILIAKDYAKILYTGKQGKILAEGIFKE